MYHLVWMIFQLQAALLATSEGNVGVGFSVGSVGYVVPEVDWEVDDCVVGFAVELDVEPAVEPFVVLASAVSEVDSAGGLVLHATSEKQSRTASNPAINLFVSMMFSFLF